jgi:hypothetical protein
MIAEVVAAGQERGEIGPRLNQEKVAMQLLQSCMVSLAHDMSGGCSK